MSDPDPGIENAASENEEIAPFQPLGFWETLRSIGPAVVVAAVVLGPGSITTASRVGTRYGYSMGWVLVLTTLLMIGMTLAALVVGTGSTLTAGQRLRRSLGRVPTAVLGMTVFLMVVLYQASNNRALLLAAELFAPSVTQSKYLACLVLVGFNVLVILFFLRARGIYRFLERSMLLLVAMMVICFGINAFAGGLDWEQAARGLVPTRESLEVVSRNITGDLRALVGTTFSVGGAFYQCYLVRERGWTRNQLRRRWIDPVVGITTLGGLTLLIMSTAASSLHGQVDAAEITDLTSLAASLRPTFGPNASIVFACGIMAGAISSFVGNALIGGTVLSDCVGMEAATSGRGPRLFTVIALLVGLVVALRSVFTNVASIDFIITVQALTTLGLPLMAAALAWLLSQTKPAMPWLFVVVLIGFVVSCFAAAVTLSSVFS